MLGGRWDLLVATLRSDILPLHERLAGATPCWDRPLAITSIPYGYMAGRSDGPWRLGDQAAVIPSFAGDGISIALHSAQLAARHYLAGKTSFEFQSRLAHDIAGPVRNATLLSRMLAHPEAQAAAIVLARLAPALLGHVASRTRIPSRYLVAADEHRPAGRGRALHS
jgi:menaquinone-9 beta-reductase